MPRKQPENQHHRFPDGFLWGASTAAHQVEGHQDNNWSRWEPAVANRLAETAPDRLRDTVPDWDLIKDDATDPNSYISGQAVDHYNRYEEDFDILAELGLNAYRFSVEWSRIEPEPGKFDQEALDHYETVVDALRERGIEPFIMLHHFTNPVWLDDTGGWHNPDTPELFARFAETVAERLKHKMNFWITINEANTYVFMRYLKGNMWPEWPDAEFSLPRALKARRNFAKAHRYARSRIRAINPDAQVGFVHTGEQFRGSGFLSNQIARLAQYFVNKFVVRPVDGYCDFIPLHHYSTWCITPRLASPAKWWHSPDTDVQNDIGWNIESRGIYDAVQMYQDKETPIYIDENGVVDARDERRGEFVISTIHALEQVMRDGADVRGYFHWSLLDCFEWSEGFWPKMGLVEVDRQTQQRRIRGSAYVYRSIIQEKGS